MGGSLSMVLDTPTALIGNINAGKFRALAVTGSRRSVVLPDVPTLNETVLPGMDNKSWQGLLAPKGTPPEIVAKLNAEIVRILKMPDVVQKLTALGIDPVGSSSDEFTKMMQSEIARWQKAVKELGIEPE
jgi:tripartite-type tricarboxylate transporter receptor subunit TctC